ncbi:hypothetical protein EZV62_009299 [Acer yangbiense]|uniref:Uncharacterized protein n=1 Tax=Acer yangbiense TaxID=1000413 RepID=A0A5C7IGA9_9ROSI|nr:hypothetical protein EZV62_009299 [Acer yangbiense]
MNDENACLRSLKMKDCNSLTFIVRGKLPSSLKKLEIENCEKLEYLWDDNEESCTSVVDEENNNNTSTSHLEYLHVEECPSLKCLSSSGHLPKELRTLSLYSLRELESIAKTFLNSRSLEEISVQFCKNLKSIPKGLHNLIHLRKIKIYNCESIDCLGEEGPPNTNLSELEIVNIEYCEKLKALPNWFHSLNSLKSLTLKGCPMYKAVLEWGLHNLTSLTSLDILGDEEAESFPQQELEMTFSHVMSVSLSFGVDILGPLVWSMDLFENSSLSFAAAVPVIKASCIIGMPNQDESDDFYKSQQYKNRHFSMLHFTRKVLPCPVVYYPSCNSFCMHEESKDKEIMNPPPRAFRAVFFLYANTQQLPGFGDRTIIC